MQSLLRWGIENTPAPGPDQPPPQTQTFDPEIIDLILGKSDAQQMKEAVECIVDVQKSMDQRLIALDNLEMLVESMDNANDLEPLKLWEPLVSLLSSDSDKIRLNTLWILGTAVQNNPRAQSAFIAQNPLPTVLSLVSSKTDGASPETRAKAVYCLSGTLKHNVDAVLKLNELGGWEVLKAGLTDPNITVRRKIAFLLNTLLLQDAEDQPNEPPETISVGSVKPTQTALRQHGIISTLLDVLLNPLPFGLDGDSAYDLDFAEKTVRVLYTFVEQGGRLNEGEREKLRRAMGDRKKDEWGFAGDEWEVLQRAVKA